MDFGEVFIDVKELPGVVVEVSSGIRLMISRSLPAVIPQGPVTKHLIVLYILPSLGIPVGEGTGKTHAFDWLLGVAVEILGRLEAQDFEDGWHDVNGMSILLPYLPFVPYQFRIVDDHGIVYSALVGLLLVPLEGCVPCHRPTSSIMVIRLCSAKLIDIGEDR